MPVNFSSPALPLPNQTQDNNLTNQMGFGPGSESSTAQETYLFDINNGLGPLPSSQSSGIPTNQSNSPTPSDTSGLVDKLKADQATAESSGDSAKVLSPSGSDSVSETSSAQKQNSFETAQDESSFFDNPLSLLVFAPLVVVPLLYLLIRGLMPSKGQRTAKPGTDVRGAFKKTKRHVQPADEVTRLSFENSLDEFDAETKSDSELGMQPSGLNHATGSRPVILTDDMDEFEVKPVFSTSATPNLQFDSIEADLNEADLNEADSIEADSIEADSIEADSIEADSIEVSSLVEAELNAESDSREPTDLDELSSDEFDFSADEEFETSAKVEELEPTREINAESHVDQEYTEDQSDEEFATKIAASAIPLVAATASLAQPTLLSQPTEDEFDLDGDQLFDDDDSQFDFGDIHSDESSSFEVENNLELEEEIRANELTEDSIDLKEALPSDTDDEEAVNNLHDDDSDLELDFDFENEVDLGDGDPVPEIKPAAEAVSEQPIIAAAETVESLPALDSDSDVFDFGDDLGEDLDIDSDDEDLSLDSPASDVPVVSAAPTNGFESGEFDFNNGLEVHEDDVAPLVAVTTSTPTESADGSEFSQDSDEFDFDDELEMDGDIAEPVATAATPVAIESESELSLDSDEFNFDDDDAEPAVAEGEADEIQLGDNLDLGDDLEIDDEAVSAFDGIVTAAKETVESPDSAFDMSSMAESTTEAVAEQADELVDSAKDEVVDSVSGAIGDVTGEIADVAGSASDLTSGKIAAAAGATAVTAAAGGSFLSRMFGWLKKKPKTAAGEIADVAAVAESAIDGEIDQAEEVVADLSELSSDASDSAAELDFSADTSEAGEAVAVEAAEDDGFDLGEALSAEDDEFELDLDDDESSIALAVPEPTDNSAAESASLSEELDIEEDSVASDAANEELTVATEAASDSDEFDFDDDEEEPVLIDAIDMTPTDELAAASDEEINLEMKDPPESAESTSVVAAVEDESEEFSLDLLDEDQEIASHSAPIAEEVPAAEPTQITDASAEDESEEFSFDLLDEDQEEGVDAGAETEATPVADASPIPEAAAEEESEEFSLDLLDEEAEGAVAELETAETDSAAENIEPTFDLGAPAQTESDQSSIAAPMAGAIGMAGLAGLAGMATQSGDDEAKSKLESEVVSLKSQLSSLENEKEILSSELASTKSELDLSARNASAAQEAAAELATLKAKLETIESEKDSLAEELETTKTELETTTSVVESKQEIETELDSLKSQLQSVQSEKESLASELETTRSELEAKSTAATELADETAREDKTNDLKQTDPELYYRFKSRLKQENRKRKDAQLCLTQAEEQRNEIAKALRAAKQELTSLTAQPMVPSTSLVAVENQLTAKTEKLTEVETEKNKFSELASKYEQETMELREKLETAETKVSEFEAKIAEAKTQVQEADSKLKSTETKLAEFELESETKVKESEAKIAEAESKAAEIEAKAAAKLAEVEAKAAEAESKITEVESKATGDTERFTELESKLAEAQAKLDESQSQLEAAEARAKSADETTNEALAAAETAESKAAGDIGKLTEIESKLADTQAKLTEAQSKLATAEALARTAEETANEALVAAQKAEDEASTLVSKTEEANRLSEELSTLKTKLSEVETKLIRNQDTAMAFQSQLVEKDEALATLRMGLEATEKTTALSDGELKSALTQIEVLKAENTRLESLQTQNALNDNQLTDSLQEELALLKSSLEDKEQIVSTAGELKSQLEKAAQERDSATRELEERTQLFKVERSQLQAKLDLQVTTPSPDQIAEISRLKTELNQQVAQQTESNKFMELVEKNSAAAAEELKTAKLAHDEDRKKFADMTEKLHATLQRLDAIEEKAKANPAPTFVQATPEATSSTVQRQMFEPQTSETEKKLREELRDQEKRIMELESEHHEALEKVQMMSKAQNSTKKTAKLSSPKTKTSTQKKARKASDKDDLTRILGIGPVIQGKLVNAGVTTFEQIAAWTKAEAQMFDEKLAFKDRVAREEWVKQAKALAREKKNNK